MARDGSDRSEDGRSTNRTNDRARETASAPPSTDSAPRHHLLDDLRPAATAGRERRAPHIEANAEHACGSRPDESIVRDQVAHAGSSSARRPHGPFSNSPNGFGRGRNAPIPRTRSRDATTPRARRNPPRRRVHDREREQVGSKRVPSFAEVDRQRVYLREDSVRAHPPPNGIHIGPAVPLGNRERAAVLAGLLQPQRSSRINRKNRRPVTS